MNLVIFIFVLCLLLLGYVYAGYPVVARLLGGLRRHRVNAAAPGSSISMKIVEIVVLEAPSRFTGDADT